MKTLASFFFLFFLSPALMPFTRAAVIERLDFGGLAKNGFGFLSRGCGRDGAGMWQECGESLVFAEAISRDIAGP